MLKFNFKKVVAHDISEIALLDNVPLSITQLACKASYAYDYSSENSYAARIHS